MGDGTYKWLSLLMMVLGLVIAIYVAAQNNSTIVIVPTDKQYVSNLSRPMVLRVK